MKFTQSLTLPHLILQRIYRDGHQYTKWSSAVECRHTQIHIAEVKGRFKLTLYIELKNIVESLCCIDWGHSSQARQHQERELTGTNPRGDHTVPASWDLSTRVHSTCTQAGRWPGIREAWLPGQTSNI